MGVGFDSSKLSERTSSRAWHIDRRKNDQHGCDHDMAQTKPPTKKQLVPAGVTLEISESNSEIRNPNSGFRISIRKSPVSRLRERAVFWLRVPEVWSVPAMTTTMCHGHNHVTWSQSMVTTMCHGHNQWSQPCGMHTTMCHDHNHHVPCTHNYVP